MIPTTWQWISIGSVANVNPRLLRTPLPDENVSFLSMSDLGAGFIAQHQTRLANEVLNGFTQFTDGDILIAKITPCFENGKGCICSGLRNGFGFGSTEFIVVRPHEGIDREFLFYQTVVESFRRSGAAGMVGSAGQKRLQPGFVRTYPIALPPLAEQTAIASVLSTWDRGIRQLSDLVAAKLALREGLVQQLLSGRQRFKQYKNSVHELVALNSVLSKVSDSVVPSRNEMYREIGVRSHGKGIFHKEPVTGGALGNKRVYRVVPGCLTLNIVFAWERAVAITTDSEKGMIASHRFPMFRPNTDRLLPEYALLFLLSKTGSQALELASPGGAGRNRTLSQTGFLKNRIPLPSLTEQHRVVSLVQAADREIELLRKQLELLKLQKKGLMQKLLTGQVRVKLPKGAK
jgi:type I restriction enzyme S subunit